MRYFEDMSVGERTELGSHTFTADEIKAFAQKFDPQRFHVDEAAAAGSHFGRLCASGWHTAAVYMRLFVAFEQREADAARARGETPARDGPSPGRTGASHLTSGQPVAPIDAASRMKPSAMIRIRIAQVCQPDAHRPPTRLERAASSSRCMGCGSNSAANALISSAVTSRGPYSVTWPGVKSSQ